MAREVLPGKCYLVTRRCVQRQYWLRPGPAVNRIVAFCLAVAAERSGVELLAWSVMSNHHHAVVYDVQGRLPEFIEHFHKLTARALNVLWRRRESLWSSEPTSCVELVDEDDILDKIAYTLANPVAAGLVERVSQWPGFSSYGFLDGNVQTFERPEQFFSKTAKRIEASLGLRIVQPPSSARKESFARWIERVEERLEACLADVRRRRKKAGKHGVVGVAKLLSQRPESVPASEVGRRKLSPAVACKDPARRMRRLLELKHFRALYRKGKADLEAGEHPAVFPRGTYRLVRLHVPIIVGTRALAA